MKDGRLYDGMSLDQVWPEKKAFGVPYWADPAASQMDDRPLR